MKTKLTKREFTFFLIVKVVILVLMFSAFFFVDELTHSTAYITLLIIITALSVGLIVKGYKDLRGG